MKVFRTSKVSFTRILPLLLVAVSVALGTLAFVLPVSSGNVEKEAARLEKRLQSRLAVMEEHMQHVMDGRDSLASDNHLQDDIVVYRYVNDTLKSWCNQFPVTNDDISNRFLMGRMYSQRMELVSPLRNVTPELNLMNLGQKWFLIKSVTEGNVQLIGGLQVSRDVVDNSSNGVNPRLHLPDRYSLRPLSTSGGVAVRADSRPVFKILCESMGSDSSANAYLLWASFFLFAFALLMILHRRKTIRCFAVVEGVLLISLGVLFVIGKSLGSSYEIFSPLLYAEGEILYSLGAVLIINLAIILTVLCTYMVRRELFETFMAKGQRSRGLIAFHSVAHLLVMVGVIIYTFNIIRSIILNSNICLELYKMDSLSIYSLVVYAAFVCLLMVIPLQLQLLRPALKMFTGLKFDPLSRKSRVTLALMFAAFFAALAGVQGFRKEQSQQVVLANRLSIDRDLSLEMRLGQAERPIATDAIIEALVNFPNAADIIMNRISENYLPRVSQDYELAIYILGDESVSTELASLLRSKMENSAPISDNSIFRFSSDKGAHASYIGAFSYHTKDNTESILVIDLESKANREDKGYAALLGFTTPGKVLIPSRYAYAKYLERSLSTSRGNYAYPTYLDDDHYQRIFVDGDRHMVDAAYCHFVNRISDDEVIVISRTKTDAFSYGLAFIFLALIFYFALCLMSYSKKFSVPLELKSGYYKSRVTSVLVVSLLFTLIAMAVVSVFFVYRTNDANRSRMMSDKIVFIQNLLANRCRTIESPADLQSKEFKATLEVTSAVAKADISIFNPDGKIIASTTPEIFERKTIGSRVNQNAYSDIVYRNSKYCILKEKIGDKKYYAMYAPVFNADGKMLGIISSPYTDDNYDFEMDAVMHLVTILTVFLILLIVARFLILAVVDRLFKPLIEMGRKMSDADIDTLEYIKYENDDEISSLVNAYNRMVTDLSESSRKLAQAERDKAWSAMARQVAHEIKNPLTPMKLQLQRLIRLKQRDDEHWQDKFDEVSKVILDHIDILTDTANEFSTFAKLYTEEETDIDVTALIQEEISMFDNIENVEFSFLGLEDQHIIGPKPQLTRVFVNLIANAVQAVQMHQQETVSSGGEPQIGHVVIQLRNSNEDGWLDIVFEDNGSGVSPDNQAKLFTPNFTTKSSGTGLGLAICKSILEKCGATISYSKSFSLGGACFTIHYPAGAREDI